MKSILLGSLLGLLLVVVPGCSPRSSSTPAAQTTASDAGPDARLVVFIGVDISGSFMNGRYFDDAIRFLAHYIHGHVNGLGGMEVPHSLFVGSIGGLKRGEPKTLYPIQSFQDRTVEQIEFELRAMFPKGKENPFTDYNAFFDQVAGMVEQRRLILKPLSIVLITDGQPDLGGADKQARFRNITLRPLESLSRNITLRVLYTDAVTAKSWQEEVPRRRVKVWTQDAVVMSEWKDARTMPLDKPLAERQKFFTWVRDNVDFQPRLRRVD